MANAIDKFMKLLQISYEEEDEEYLQDELDDHYEEEKPRGFFRRGKKNEEEQPEEQPVKKERKPKEAKKAPVGKQAGNVSVIKGGASANMNSEIVSIRPYDDSAKTEIGQQLLNGKNVLINLEGLDVDIAQRIVDFTAGVCYAIGGAMKYPSKFFVLAVPRQVELTGFFEGEEQPAKNPMNVTFDKFPQF